jgi:lipopolysaccharide export system protein LptC
MRPLFLSLGASILLLSIAWAQNAADGGSGVQLPVGQTFKQFEFPVYENGKLKYTGSAVEAKGITLNRAEASDLKIESYENGVVTTTITSPKADIYVAEQKMRTKNTVKVERADMETTSQTCDFDLKTKKYVFRNNVKVILKHFDLSLTPANGTAPASAHAPKSSSSPSLRRPASVQSQPDKGSILDSPGAYSDTNSAPIPPPNSDLK